MKTICDPGAGRLAKWKWTAALALSLLCCRQAAHAQGQNNASVPFLPAQFSVFNPGAPTTPARMFNFVLPDQYLSALAQPAVSVISMGLNRDNAEVKSQMVPFAITAGADFASLQAIPPYTVSCPDNGQADGSAETALNMNVQMLVMQEDDLEDEVNNRVLPTYHTDLFSAGDYTVQEITMQYQIQGGEFDGETVPLHGQMAFASGKNTTSGPSDSSEEWDGILFVVLNWGVDPLGNTNYLMAQLTFSVSANTSSSDCLSLQDAIQNTLGTSTVEAYFTPEWNALVAQVSDSSQMYLQGAIPDLLYVYDYSAQNTVTPDQTLPPDTLDADTVLALKNSYPPGYTNAYKTINQYDNGKANNLPVRFSHAGGNACGPTSLGMDLWVQGVSSVDARAVYDNTTENGLAAGTNENAFSGYRAKEWLQHLSDWRPQGFSAPSPLDPGTIVSLRWSTAKSRTDPRIVATWADIDRLLQSQTPVVIRTDLGVGTGPGSGHMILVLGIGNNPDLAQMYATAFGSSFSGDYYIVADPAGCFFANFDGTHYSDCLSLAKLNAGMNFGGWYAMYPKELLQQRFTQGFPTYTVLGLVIGAPFTGINKSNRSDANKSLTASAHCPIVYTITDPLGRQSGLNADGSVVLNIPNSYFTPAFQEEEEQGTNSIDPLGPKGFEIDNPIDGIYRVDISGTNSGPFEFDWSPMNNSGVLVNAFTNSGAAAAGSKVTYTPIVATGGTPSVEVMPANNGLALFWPTNASGFSLQSATDLSGTTWTTVAGPFSQSNGLFSFTNNAQGTQMFYRLKN